MEIVMNVCFCSFLRKSKIMLIFHKKMRIRILLIIIAHAFLMCRKALCVYRILSHVITTCVFEWGTNIVPPTPRPTKMISSTTVLYKVTKHPFLVDTLKVCK